MSKIETGVDKLVELVNQSKSISINEAAKKLGVSDVVVQEWADFLEEEKIISIEYKLNKTVLSERKLSNKEVKVKEKDYGNKKDAFVRKVESYMKSIDSDSLGLEKLKGEFDSLKKEIGNEVYKVKDEVQKLENYEDLQKNLEKEITKQKAEYQAILDSAHTQIKAEEKRYQSLLQELEIEKREFQIKEQRLKSLEDKETDLIAKLKGFVDLVKNVEVTVNKEKGEIGIEEHHVRKLESMVDKIEEDIGVKKRELMALLDSSKKHEEQVIKRQEDILNKVKLKTDSISGQLKETELMTAKFKQFFDKKVDIENLLKKADAENQELKNEFADLVKKATAFNLATKSADADTHIIKLNKDLIKIDKKRESYKQKIKKLIKLIKG
ncbi:MAG: hypothetical protein KKF44_07875 [Nanoarchaeota archaeon]|nr:hypothetical protein [Nanoarchaeota archaeon]